VKAPVFVVQVTSRSEANYTLVLISVDDNNNDSCTQLLISHLPTSHLNGTRIRPIANF
jgi:hypothetical protein